jgi:EAL domain-containing protein (putative c-di-GMP-specific phosphodiesterase class I)
MERSSTRLYTGQGYIQANEFIPLAESTGLIEHIGTIVMKKICLQGKAWIDAGNEPLLLSDNLSPYQLLYGNTVEVVEDILKERGYSPHCLELELTESALMERED